MDHLLLCCLLVVGQVGLITGGYDQRINFFDDGEKLFLADHDRQAFESLKRIHSSLSQPMDSLMDDIKEPLRNCLSSHGLRNSDELTIPNIFEFWYAWSNNSAHNWTVDDVIQWLTFSVGMHGYEAEFRRLRITGDSLLNFVEPQYFDIQFENPEHLPVLVEKVFGLVLFGPQQNNYLNWIFSMALWTLFVVIGVSVGFYKFSPNKVKPCEPESENLFKLQIQLDNLRKIILNELSNEQANSPFTRIVYPTRSPVEFDELDGVLRRSSNLMASITNSIHFAEENKNTSVRVELQSKQFSDLVALIKLSYSQQSSNWMQQITWLNDELVEIINMHRTSCCLKKIECIVYNLQNEIHSYFENLTSILQILHINMNISNCVQDSSVSSCHQLGTESDSSSYGTQSSDIMRKVISHSDQFSQIITVDDKNSCCSVSQPDDHKVCTPQTVNLTELKSTAQRLSAPKSGISKTKLTKIPVPSNNCNQKSSLTVDNEQQIKCQPSKMLEEFWSDNNAVTGLNQADVHMPTQYQNTESFRPCNPFHSSNLHSRFYRTLPLKDCTNSFSRSVPNSQLPIPKRTD